MKNNRVFSYLFTPLLFLIFTCHSFATEGVAITGELKKWHKVTLTFNGPRSSETANKNPFTDYRLNVQFSKGNQTLTVPGYFAADGNADNTSAKAGNKWRVHFSPPATGTWRYKALFKTGSNVAISLNADAGSPVFSIHGKTGQFNIAASDKTGRDHRGKGRLNYVGGHYLRFAQSGKYFLKAGSDSPENFLAYDDFDDTPNNGGYRKSWAKHKGDYRAADAKQYTWKNGKGTEMLGAIKYLSDQGMNAFSTLSFNLNGDDKNIFPHLALKAGASKWSDVHHTRFDVSKMAQWENIFEYADKKGVYIHIKLTETENEAHMDGGDTGLERKVYLREMIARFAHHLALNWNIGEENGDYGSVNMNDAQRRSMAKYIKNVDPYNNHIVAHTSPSGHDKVYTPLLGNKSVITGASVQTNWHAVHYQTLRWLKASANAGKKWVVANDEQNSAGVGVATDASYPFNKGKASDNRKQIRQDVLWGNLMAGGAGVEYYFGYDTGETDLTAQDYRSRATKWKDARIALNFFNRYLPFNGMKSMDDITSVNDDYVFAKVNHTYVVYLPDGGGTNINLPKNANYAVRWFNPRSGGALTSAKVVNGYIKAPTNDDWVALIKRSN